MKRNFWKMGLAAAITITGVVTAVPQKMVNAATLKAPIKRVQINYLPGKSVKIWTNYDGGQLIAFHAKDKSKWNVVEVAVDRKQRLWYRIGPNEWIEARYTVDINQTKSKSIVAKKKNNRNNRQKERKRQRFVNQVAKSKNKVIISKLNINKIKGIEKTSVNKQTATVEVNKRAKAVADLARSQVGKGYAWGGNGPDNFDCSGLVQYIYNKVGGISLPRVTTDQVKVGVTVAMNQLQPGDLLYWGSPDAPYHVGIYIGNNQYVNAASPDQGVVQQTISSYFYPCIAKRVIQ
ncbi:MULTISPECIES: C40 family peptidase [unclassified Lactobacillus]|uniref:C40 family peptidase n=1 Tax=unclassified Lactobacillus TaxID=2620435 RepID=UPI000EFC5BD9|nr:MULTISPECIES: C40 family peptidase [unclassified Lactobacillus]RMC23694.1 NlpC/P60 family protein [Lactobacillus sp. ESL0247]RMC27454.1 NlpC/P60 family protein [Lactobacillus sp. ESL0246]RMC30655.1 NlpC/P60 family protein [Lactobacillus sp. ESL0245]RMC47234.1 NlpC/P60 family protein [Lactobacillus sp. ESL0228]